MVQRSRVEVLREQKAKIDEQLRLALTRENAKNRKQDTREKIICGVMFQGAIADGHISEQLYRQLADKYLNDRDRSLVTDRFQKFSGKNRVESKPLDCQD